MRAAADCPRHNLAGQTAFNADEIQTVLKEAVELTLGGSQAYREPFRPLYRHVLIPMSSSVCRARKLASLRYLPPGRGMPDLSLPSSADHQKIDIWQVLVMIALR